MKPCLLPLLLLPLVAQADTLYKCTDESGQLLYTNQKNSMKNCTVLSRDLPISTFSAPKPKAATPTPTPGDFPRVSVDQQKARDTDRRSILNTELEAEQKHLEAAKKSLAEQEGKVDPQERNVGGGINQAKVQERLQRYSDSVQLHERNIEALKKEMGNLK